MKMFKNLKRSYEKRGVFGFVTKASDLIGKKEKNKANDLLNKKLNWEMFHELEINEVRSKYKTRDLVHDYYTHHFDNILPSAFKRHRHYFNQEHRGFGESAFHSMWMHIFKEFKPKEILEIGVYRGQTLTLFAMLSSYFKLDANITGISPLTNAGDEVSQYLKKIDYAVDIFGHFDYFNLKRATLHKAFSTDESALALIKSKKWDLIYIDGSHDYEIVKSDYEVCKSNLSPNGILVFDDSSASYEFSRAFKGHPGPSKLISETVMNEMEHVIGVGHNNAFKFKKERNFTHAQMS